MCAELFVLGFVEYAVEDAVGVPGGGLGDEGAVGCVEGEEYGGVKVGVVSDEVPLHEVDGFGGVASDGFRYGGLGLYD